LLEAFNCKKGKVSRVVCNDKSTCVMVREIDDGYINIREDYNRSPKRKIETDKKAIYVNNYYRNLLELNKGDKVDVTLDQEDNLCGIIYSLCFFNKHINPIVRINFWMTIIAIIISIVSLFATVYPYLN